MKDKKGYIYLVGIAFELTAMVVGGAFLGKYVGEEYDKAALGTLVGVLLGFFFWIFRILATLGRVNRSDD